MTDQDKTNETSQENQENQENKTSCWPYATS